MLQNIRALSTLGHNIDSKFMTSLIQLKLDANTTFAWREASKDALKGVPDYEDLLKFVDQRARSADGENSWNPSVSLPEKKQFHTSKAAVATHVSTTSFAKGCQLCPGEKHPLYYCPKFKTMSLEERKSSLSTNNACFNCLKAGHKASQCQSLQE